jgi:hypothetical protein
MGRGGRTGHKNRPAKKKKHLRTSFTFLFKYDVLLDYFDSCPYTALQTKYAPFANKSVPQLRVLVGKWMKNCR